ncbi:MAG: CGNR zinc finger domain-containing protein [Pyrinomonadaceae bacterium]
MSETAAGQNFYFVANDLSLDLVNTEAMIDGRPADLLGEFADLLAWAERTEILDRAGARRLSERWAGTREASRALESARALRARLRALAEHVAKGAGVPQASVDEINNLLRRSAGHYEVRRVRGGFEKRLLLSCEEPSQLLVPVAEAAADLLCHGDLSLVRKCESQSCILYFYDTTKNHSRRWCSMSACGNRLKVAAHYQRRREGAPAAAATRKRRLTQSDK